MGMSTGPFISRVGQHQLALFGGHADHRERAALALAQGLNSGSEVGRTAST
jgi:hypothetical protein